MAERPVFVPVFDGPLLVKTHLVPFEWFPGMAVIQKQKSIDSLHLAATNRTGLQNLLEVSSKSRDKLGVSLSAFNLTFETTILRHTMSVECAYQGSKVFENGGPYVDLFGVSSKQAKTDERLRSSGKLHAFKFCGVEWALEPQTAFYDWLYVNALNKHPELWTEILTFQAFTDIEFNPERSINCQAYSVALFSSLHHRGWLGRAKTREGFLSTLRGSVVSNSREDHSIQSSINLDS
jgi:hypothetical protein